MGHCRPSCRNPPDSRQRNQGRILLWQPGIPTRHGSSTFTSTSAPTASLPNLTNASSLLTSTTPPTTPTRRKEDGESPDAPTPPVMLTKTGVPTPPVMPAKTGMPTRRGSPDATRVARESHDANEADHGQLVADVESATNIRAAELVKPALEALDPNKRVAQPGQAHAAFRPGRPLQKSRR